jgi:hypothetical protein
MTLNFQLGRGGLSNWIEGKILDHILAEKQDEHDKKLPPPKPDPTHLLEAIRDADEALQAVETEIGNYRSGYARYRRGLEEYLHSS